MSIYGLQNNVKQSNWNEMDQGMKGGYLLVGTGLPPDVPAPRRGERPRPPAGAELPRLDVPEAVPEVPGPGRPHPGRPGQRHGSPVPHPRPPPTSSPVNAQKLCLPGTIHRFRLFLEGGDRLRLENGFSASMSVPALYLFLYPRDAAGKHTPFFCLMPA